MLIYFFLSLMFSLGFTPLVRKLALYWGVVDAPTKARKIHKTVTPLLGGLAIFLSFFVTLVLAVFLGKIDFNLLPIKFLVGIFLGSLVLMLGGFLDDKYTLPPKWAILAPAVASLIVVVSGIGVGIQFLNSPLGGEIRLDYLLLGLPASAIFTWVWVLSATYTTKILDGLDGLVSGVGAIAGFVLFALSLRPEVLQTSTALVALVLAGSLIGFLPFAWHPAKIFLGEGGSTFVGFILGTLAVLAGAKVATAILVMGLPILDVLWAVVRRILRGKNPFQGDREHLHHLFLNAGLSHRQAVLCYYAVSLVFGLSAVFLQTKGKFWAIVGLFALMGLLVPILTYFSRKGRANRPQTLDKLGIK